MADDGVYFSELSPRLNDTVRVTLVETEKFSEFEFHTRVVLGFPIPEITLKRVGASAVILALNEGSHLTYKGVNEAMDHQQCDIQISGQPITRSYHRMAVALTYDKIGVDVDVIKKRAIEIAKMVRVESIN